MQLIGYRKCSTCNIVSKQIKEKGFDLNFRDYTEEKLTRAELKELYQLSNLDIKKFFNTSGKIYKENNYKDKIATMSIDEALDLLAANPMLIKRPIVKDGNDVFVSKKSILDRYL